MAVSSYILDDHGHGRGHTEHGNGKGLGHLKHAQRAAEDGVYGITIEGIDASNATTVDVVSPPTTLADGSTLTTEVRAGAISTSAAPGGDGEALHLVTDSNSGRLRVHVQFDEDQRVALGDLDTLSFDYFIQSSDQTNQTPVLRVWVDGDGNLATTADRGELVFEWAYQGLGATTQGSWQTADLAGDDWVAWQRANGMNLDQVANMTELSDWADADGYTPAGGVHFDEDSLVLGFSLASGSGNGTNNFYVDNVQVGGVTYDFDV